jgi:hypothetical protein
MVQVRDEAVYARNEDEREARGGGRHVKRAFVSSSPISNLYRGQGRKKSLPLEACRRYRSWVPCNRDSMRVRIPARLGQTEGGLVSFQACIDLHQISQQMVWTDEMGDGSIGSLDLDEAFGADWLVAASGGVDVCWVVLMEAMVKGEERCEQMVS